MFQLFQKLRLHSFVIRSSVTCKRDGFVDGTDNIHSGTEGMVFGNIILGGLVGWGIDSAVGADNKYADVTTINMTPISAVPRETSNLIPKATILPTENEAQSLEEKPKGVTSRLELLEQLKKQGLITEGDYKDKKAKILSEL